MHSFLPRALCGRGYADVDRAPGQLPALGKEWAKERGTEKSLQVRVLRAATEVGKDEVP